MRYVGDGSELWRVRIDLVDTAKAVYRREVEDALPRRAVTVPEDPHYPAMLD
jgi:hypothetical protein